MKSIVCSKCQSPVPADATFCGACGAKIAPPPSPSRGSGRRWLPAAIAGGVLLLALTAGVGYFLLFRNGTELAPSPDSSVSSASGAASIAAQKAFDEGSRMPVLEGLMPAANPLPLAQPTTLEALVRNEENLSYHIFWESTCGVVAPSPDDRKRAVYLPPQQGGNCRVTVEVKSQNMLESQKREVTLIVVSGDEEMEPGV